MKKLTVVFLLFFCLLETGQKIYSQAPPPVKLPDVIPPPPDAGALGKYGDVPVSMNSGLPNINIPVYNIATPRLTLPISLNYYAAGVKVDDIASWVGLEWTLNAGGVITRSIRGIDDFASGGYYNTTVPLAANITPQNSWRFFENYILHTQDADPDYFFYNFGNQSGKFFFNESKQPAIINYQEPLKIQYSASGFSIKDDKGNTYYFNSPEHATSGDHNGALGQDHIMSWYLSKIISFDNSDTISFSYFTDNLYEQDNFTYIETVGPYYSSGSGCQRSFQNSGHDGCCGSINGEPFTQSTPLRLQEIDFKNGKIVFYSSTGRLDLPDVKLDSIVVSNYNFATNQFSPIKKVKFSYNYFYTNLPNLPPVVLSHYRMRLDTVKIFGGDNTPANNYNFVYDATTLPYISGCAKDLFGFYNGQNTNTSLIPTQNITYNGFPYTVGAADRTTDPNSIQAGILKRVYYPTGGYTDFTYEPNSYGQSGLQNVTQSVAASGQVHQADSVDFVPTSNSNATLTISFLPFNYTTVHSRPYVLVKNVTTGQSWTTACMDAVNGSTSVSTIVLIAGQTYRLIGYAFDDSRVITTANIVWQQSTGSPQSVYGGGLRIKQITDYNFNGRFVKSELYKYGVAECGYGYLPSPATLLNTNSYTKRTIFDCVDDLGLGLCSAGTYVTTRESFVGSPIYDIFSLAGPPVSYTEVAKYVIDSLGDNIGKTINNYSTYQNSILPSSSPYAESIYLENSGYIGGQLCMSRDYALKNTNYWIRKQTIYQYNNTALQQGRGLRLGLNSSYPIPNLYLDSTSAPSCWNQAYYYFDYNIHTGTVLPAAIITNDYDMNDTTKYLTTTKQFTYDNLDHLQPTQIFQDLSDGGTQLTINRYPAEVDSIGNLSSAHLAAINALKAGHSNTTLLQTQEFKNGIPVRLTRNDYKINWANVISLDSVETMYRSNAIDTRLTYKNYDSKGNLLYVSKPNDEAESYQWGYNGAYPVAAIKNAVNSSTFVPTQTTITGSLNLPPNSFGQQSTNFASTSIGPITVTIPSGSYLGAPGGATVSGQFSLIGPTTQSGNLCISSTPSNCGSTLSSYTFNNMPVGNYVFTFTAFTNTTSVTIPLQFSYIGTQMVPSGINEFFYEGFEENSSAVSGIAHTGSKYWNGSYTVPFITPNGRNYLIQWWTGPVTWTFHQQAYTSNMVISGTIDDVRVLPSDAEITTYTYSPLVGMTSETDHNGVTTYFEYDGLERLKNVKDYQGNIVKNYQYNYGNSCGTNCYVLPMQTLNGNNTIGYPVGVFDLFGNWIGNASSQSQYVSVWNSNSNNQVIGSIAAGSDAMHFKMTVNPGKNPLSAVTGCRYYQYDLAYNQIDGLRNVNGAYIDFGDGIRMKFANGPTDIPSPLPANTTAQILGGYAYFIHTYPDSTQKTITVFHNDADERFGLDNYASPANSMIRVKNLRGNFPQNIRLFGFSSYQQSTATTVANITNWNSITSITEFNINNGDNLNPSKNMSFSQDFMQNNPGLHSIWTARYGPSRTGYRDTTFKLSRLKSDWNTYFTNIDTLVINEDHWSHEDLSGLKKLSLIIISSTTQNHQDGGQIVALSSGEIDSVINQVAAGAGQFVNNGVLTVGNAGTRTSASDASVSFLKSKGWQIRVNGTLL